ncbi:50S ribosomal protein L25 [Patescibacteria group bacterium]|nr:50S ribosomal protein L25 [Patescibacteria group bacterium]
MKTEIKLNVEKREILGRKVKKLREGGVLPANIYGPKVESLAIQLITEDFIEIYKESGETELVYLQVKGEKGNRPVLVRHLQVHPVTNRILHADFLQVDLTEETTAAVPVVFANEAPAVKKSKGILLELINELEVTCLPTDIPSEIKVDISGLKEINDVISIKDLKLPPKVKTAMDPEEPICKIEAPQEEKVEDEVPEETPAEETTETKDEGSKDAEETTQKE